MRKEKYKIALIGICLNQHYWEYATPMLESARRFFLTDHDVSYFLWSDMPEETAERLGVVHIPTEPIFWPMPTLMRYHLFLKEEERLKEFDYIFYCDVDMLFVSKIGDEILGDGLTAADHPMYALRPELHFPVEKNPLSTAYIKIPEHYYAGGFQGGKSKDFIKAMKAIKKNIDKDFTKNYMARWNDESHWNRYLLDNPPAVNLSAAYVYPDSLIDDYYIKIWGKNYEPKIITLTKKFSLSKEGGAAVQRFRETF